MFRIALFALVVALGTHYLGDFADLLLVADEAEAGGGWDPLGGGNGAEYGAGYDPSGSTGQNDAGNIWDPWG